ncbi:unnamed protein product, partial [Mesorhabditis belari]|uniref:Uncharacterized protein n=1 Tax=Mesorhabditis belari TaxID=2138241 RepID=A0AAF3F5Z8_9BILA
MPLAYPVYPMKSIIIAQSIYSLVTAALFTIYWRLWVYNHDVFKVLSDMQFGEKGYTLGVRFQVEENIRAMKLLRCFVIFNTVFIFINCFFGIMALEVFDTETPGGQLILQTFDLLIAVYTLSMLVICLYYVDEWGEQFLVSFFSMIGRNMQGNAKNAVKPLNSVQETDFYFNYYRQSW